MNIPNDPVMLLSYINTQLRDFYPTLNELCSELNLSKDELCSKLSAIDYEYDEEANQFVSIQLFNFGSIPPPADTVLQKRENITADVR